MAGADAILASRRDGSDEPGAERSDGGKLLRPQAPPFRQKEFHFRAGSTIGAMTRGGTDNSAPDGWRLESGILAVFSISTRRELAAYCPVSDRFCPRLAPWRSLDGFLGRSSRRFQSLGARPIDRRCAGALSAGAAHGRRRGRVGTGWVAKERNGLCTFIRAQPQAIGPSLPDRLPLSRLDSNLSAQPTEIYTHVPIPQLVAQNQEGREFLSQARWSVPAAWIGQAARVCALQVAARGACPRQPILTWYEETDDWGTS